MIVTIDGPAGAGKSTAARSLADRLGVPYLDTGAMFRAYTFLALERGLDMEDKEALAALVREVDLDLRPEGAVYVGDRRLDTELRRPEVTKAIRHLAGSGTVRAPIADEQRAVARRWGRLVCDGRDTGSVIYPDADVKFYLDASIEERARRRAADLEERGVKAPSLKELEADIAERDRTDREREVGPLVRPEDAISIDSSVRGPEEVLALMLEHVRGRMSADDDSGRGGASAGAA